MSNNSDEYSFGLVASVFVVAFYTISYDDKVTEFFIQNRGLSKPWTVFSTPRQHKRETSHKVQHSLHSLREQPL